MNSFPRRKSTEKSETISTPPSSNLSSRNKRHHSVVCCRDFNKMDVAWTSFFLEILFALPASYFPIFLTHFIPQRRETFPTFTLKLQICATKCPLLLVKNLFMLSLRCKWPNATLVGSPREGWNKNCRLIPFVRRPLSSCKIEFSCLVSVVVRFFKIVFIIAIRICIKSWMRWKSSEKFCCSCCALVSARHQANNREME